MGGTEYEFSMERNKILQISLYINHVNYISIRKMVLFISGLAQGLARENISYLNNMPAEHYIVEDNKEPKLESSQLNQSQQNKIEKIIHENATQMGTQTLKINQQDQDVITLNTPKHLTPKLVSGNYPKTE